MATVLVLGRLCDASRELHLAERFYQSSAPAELLSVPAEKVNEDRLCRALDALLPHKAALEKHFKEKPASCSRPGGAEPASPAGLFARSSARLQTGPHCAGGKPLRDASGL